MKSNKILTGCSLLMLFFPLAYIFIGTMLAIYSIGLPYREFVKVGLSFVGCAGLFTFLIKIKKVPVIFCVLALFILQTLVPSFMKNNAHGSEEWAVMQVGDSLLWIAVFFLAYYIGYRRENAMLYAKFVAFLIPVFAILFLQVKAFSANRGIPLISTAYFTLFLLPFALLIKNTIIKWGLVIIVFATVLLSVKRTGFIAFIVTMGVYFIMDLRNKHNGNKLRKITLYILLGIGLWFFFEYYVSTHNIGILDRMASISEDKGSGRVEVWITTWKMICNSDPISLIVGHGFNAVYLDSPLKLSAHTDLLEVIYDYGIIGSTLYTLFYVQLWKYYKKIKKWLPELSSSFMVSIALVICMSTVSHLLIYPTHFLFLCAFWGISIGEYRRKISVRRSVKEKNDA